MNKLFRFASLSSALVALMSGEAIATSFADLHAGTNITINDTIWNSTHNGGSPALNIGGEDNETEKTPSGLNTYTGQRWDFEGMFWNGSVLTLIAGWNFQTGVSEGDKEFVQVGDLFLGTLGENGPGYTNGKPFTATEALDFSRVADGGLEEFGSYTKYSAGNFTTSDTTGVAPLADPFQVTGGTNGITDSSFTYTTGVLTDNAGFQGWKDSDVAGKPFNDIHYYMQISGLGDPELASAILHITLGCGNDVGRGEVPVPEPTTMLLFGTGLTGLAFFARRRNATL